MGKKDYDHDEGYAIIKTLVLRRDLKVKKEFVDLLEVDCVLNPICQTLNQLVK